MYIILTIILNILSKPIQRTKTQDLLLAVSIAKTKSNSLKCFADVEVDKEQLITPIYIYGSIYKYVCQSW